MRKKKLIEVLKNTINNLEEELKRANSKVDNRDKLVKEYQIENEILLNKINKKQETLERIKALVECNKYDNEKAIFNKIKELIPDYQSEN